MEIARSRPWHGFAGRARPEYGSRLDDELRLHRRTVHTGFDLLGDKGDDITYSLGWALVQSNELVEALLREAV